VIPTLPTASNTLQCTSCISHFLTKICLPRRPNAEFQAGIFLWLGAPGLAQVSYTAKRPPPGERGWSLAGSSLCRFLLVSALGRQRLFAPRRGAAGFTSEPALGTAGRAENCGCLLKRVPLIFFQF